MKLAFTLALGSTAVWAQSIPPAMYKQGCELLGKKIFCFGGAVRDIYSANPTYNDDFLSGHYVLDLSNFTTLQDAANLQWQQVPDPAGYQLEARGNFATAKVSDNSYIVFGGAGPKKTYEASALVNLTTIYSADTNTWRTVDTSAVPSDSPIAKQAWGATAVPNGKDAIYFFGGTPPSQSANIFNISNELLMVKSANSDWSKLTAQSVNTMPPVGVTSWYNLTYMYFPTVNSGLDMAPDGNIYGYGGLQSQYGISNATGNANKYTDTLNFGEDISGQQIYTYFPSNTTSNYSTNYGIYVYPKQRSLHTFTALPNSNNFLLYGGISTMDGVEPDYCFTFDYTKSTWAKVNFQGGDPGARYGHSAVLYKDALFIMFGANASGQMQNSVYVMNTTTFTWSQVPITTNSTGTGSTGGGGSSISGGTIAGIVVGVVAGVALIGGLVFFLVRRGTFSSSTGNQFSAPIYGNEGFGDDFARPTDTRFDQPASGMRMVSPHGPSTVSDTYEVMSQPSQLTSNYDGATVIKPTEGSVADGSVKPTEYAYSQVVKPTEYEYSQIVKPTEYVQQTYTGKPDGF